MSVAKYTAHNLAGSVGALVFTISVTPFYLVAIELPDLVD